jgi:gluconolactonase
MTNTGLPVAFPTRVTGSETPPHRVVAEGLRFPEGPIAMADGSVVVVEVRGGGLTRVDPDGTVTELVQLSPGGHGGANGAAVGPDGAIYVCNNGGFAWTERDGIFLPFNPGTGDNTPPGYTGGWIDRVDLATGEHRVLYPDCDGTPFLGPNDIVFDSAGGFWFTDLGKTLPDRWPKGAVYYAHPDGSSVQRVITGLNGPNGVGLSPDGATVYVAETSTGRLWAWDLVGPGQVHTVNPGPAATGNGGRCLANTLSHFDSLAVEENGNIVVAAISNGLCVVSPDGASIEFVAMPDFITTNVCFGGPDRRTAFVTLSGVGQLLAVDWPRPGLALEY